MPPSTTIHAHDLTFTPLLPAVEIQRRVKELGDRITDDYRGRCPLFLGVLNGAFVFAADLIRHCRIDAEISFIKLASYHGTESSGEVKKLIGLTEEVEGRDVILVEDIVDSGRTLHEFLPDLRRLNPRSIEVASLLLKPDALEHEIDIRYLGFEIPDQFVIGYGLDYDGLGRNLPAIYRRVE